MSSPANQAEFLLRFLSDQDIPCPSCGYNLRGLTGQVCPECGEAIAVQVGLVEPKMAAAIAGLIGLAAGTGLNGLLLIYAFLRVFLMNNSYGGMGQFFLVTGIGFGIEGPAMFLWLKFWRAIRRQQKGRKTFLVVAAWFLTLGDLVVFSIAIR